MEKTGQSKDKSSVFDLIRKLTPTTNKITFMVLYIVFYCPVKSFEHIVTLISVAAIIPADFERVLSGMSLTQTLLSGADKRTHKG